MKKHTSITSDHYDYQADAYDGFNEKSSSIINAFLAKMLKKHKIKTVLDMTCGTGSQVFYLSEKGFDLTGLDISPAMLKVARKKAQQNKQQYTFIEGDIRTSKVGEFDAVISIFNAIGHLTKADFKKALKNIKNNLKAKGLYIFDINNLSYLLYKDTITKLTIDWQQQEGDSKVRYVQHSTIDASGILTSYSTLYKQKGNNKARTTHHEQTLQVYSLNQLQEFLQQCGFTILEVYDALGKKFSEYKSDRILVIAQKKG